MTWSHTGPLIASFLTVLFRSWTINFGIHMTIYKDLVGSYIENHIDWTQLQVARAFSRLSCVPVQARLAFNHPLFLSSSFLRLSFLPLWSTTVHKVRLCCVQACVFLGRCIHAFSSLLLLSDLPLPTLHTAVFLGVSLHPPAHPKEIKPHLTSLIIVVTYDRRAPPSVCETNKRTNELLSRMAQKPYL